LTGITDGVSSLAFDETHDLLYVSGDFKIAGGTSIHTVAKWDGSTWSPLGNGINGSVASLAFDSIDLLLYVGGRYEVGGDTATQYFLLVT
jgi:hypothetical protein